MKKILILLFTLVASIAFAQEKQNDATWEETVEFISKNIHNLWGYPSDTPSPLKVENEYIIGSNSNGTVKFQLIQVTRAEQFHNSRTIIISTFGNSIFYSYPNNGSSGYYSEGKFRVESSKEVFDRLLIAF